MKRFLLVILFAAASVGFAGLSIWQFERRSWKIDLVERVNARIKAPPVDIPDPKRWAFLSGAEMEYLRVKVSGAFLNDRTTLVDARAQRGSGAWVLTPLVTDAGTVLVNRGFIPDKNPAYFQRAPGPVSVIGLVRLSEPEGVFLRANRPDQNIWYSRDVAAIANRRNLGPVAPFFIDAERSAADAYPIGGLTMVRFRNAHLVYALVWMALSFMAAFGTWSILVRHRN